MRKPRPFSHKPIFINARRDRLSDVEQRARHQLGLEQPDGHSPADLHGVFGRGLVHVKRHRASGAKLTPTMMLVLIVVLFLIWKLLL